MDGAMAVDFNKGLVNMERYIEKEGLKAWEYISE
jgi:hypothetical protein